jgi:superfamily II DNA or RNA helicase
VGLIQGSTMDWRKPVVLATYQTMAARAEVLPLDVIRWFGLVIWDELHHLSAETFSKSASLFPGYRLGLSATPVRDDGRHVIADGHLGPVIYKNLETDLKPLVVFYGTGFSCDLYHTNVAPHVLDSTGEVHYKKLSAYLGTHPEHQTTVVTQVVKAVKAGRKVLVLSESIDELVNLFALYIGCPPGSLFTDVVLDPAAYGLQGQSTKPLTRVEINRLKTRLSGHAAKARLAGTSRAAKAHIYETILPTIKAELFRHDKALVYQKDTRKAQEAFIKSCLSRKLAGLIIARIKPELREAMIAQHQVTFAIMKYGKEGLNSKALDTVILTTPIAQKAMLQQVMGRTGREYEGKREPLVIVIEHDIGPLMGMCRKMRRHLTNWLPEDGGPYSFTRYDGSANSHVKKSKIPHDLYR